MQETIGQRVARLRHNFGWTQEQLAERIAISRVAISHIEMDLTTPSERTITLLAGLFRQSPPELVEGTTYPRAKADRLPTRTCCHGELDLELAIAARDLLWLERLSKHQEASHWASEVEREWLPRLAKWDSEALDVEESERLGGVRKLLLASCRRATR